jgi:hypothetical protein
MKLVCDLKMNSFKSAIMIGLSLLHMISGTLINVTELLVLGSESGTPILRYLHIPT